MLSKQILRRGDLEESVSNSVQDGTFYMYSYVFNSKSKTVGLAPGSLPATEVCKNDISVVWEFMRASTH